MLCPEYWKPNNYELAKDNLYLIQLELAIICDSSTEYYKACYNLEGNIYIA